MSSIFIEMALYSNISIIFYVRLSLTYNNMAAKHLSGYSAEVCICFLKKCFLGIFKNFCNLQPFCISKNFLFLMFYLCNFLKLFWKDSKIFIKKFSLKAAFTTLFPGFLTSGSETKLPSFPHLLYGPEGCPATPITHLFIYHNVPRVIFS